MLFGCYRKGDAEDPVEYVRAIATVLASYPEDVVIEVTDPVRGLPSRLSFLPTVAEVVAACEALMRPRRERFKAQAQIEDTWRLLAPPPPLSDDERQAAVERHWTQGARVELNPPRQPQESSEQIMKRLYADYIANPKPLTIGPGLAEKIEGMKAEREMLAGGA